jgi:hypothetical protein
MFKRITSQKSQYSRKNMKKSYENLSTLARRTVGSRVSASGRSSSARSEQGKPQKWATQQHQYQIETTSVESIKKEELLKFKSVFRRDTENKKHLAAVGLRRKQHLSQVARKNITAKLPYLTQRTEETIKFQQRNPESCKRDFSLLHKIAEEMLGRTKEQDRV